MESKHRDSRVLGQIPPADARERAPMPSGATSVVLETPIEVTAVHEALARHGDERVPPTRPRLDPLIADELARARCLADEAMRQRSELLALLSAISHDLRTPLTAILGYGDLLLMGVQGSLADAQRDSLQRVRASAQQLLELLTDTLSFARHETEGLECRSEPVDIADVLTEASVHVHQALAAKRVRFQATIAPGLLALADRDRVVQILRSMLTTSMRFAEPEGTVSVVADEIDGVGDAGARRVRVRVRDSGIGLSPEQLLRLFDPYRQAVARDARVPGMIELGLSVGRDLARAMGGDLVAESEPDLGSALTLTLPVASR